MDKNDNGGVPGMRQVTPLIGQRWLEVEVPAEVRKLPLGVPVSLCGLFMQDKRQLDRIEEKLDRLLALSEPRASGVQPAASSQYETLPVGSGAGDREVVVEKGERGFSKGFSF